MAFGTLSRCKRLRPLPRPLPASGEGSSRVRRGQLSRGKLPPDPLERLSQAADSRRGRPRYAQTPDPRERRSCGGLCACTPRKSMKASCHPGNLAPPEPLEKLFRGSRFPERRVAFHNVKSRGWPLICSPAPRKGFPGTAFSKQAGRVSQRKKARAGRSRAAPGFWDSVLQPHSPSGKLVKECFSSRLGRPICSLPSWIAFIRKAMLRASTRMVCRPSASFSTSSAV